ncbi:MAG: hypothetical protein CME93_06870 [Hyphomonadaceae bacterium]|nr:hypothetical protein [Hyphomonadaceae bacterium]OUX93672.1 MAG: hypothetical protein CBB77_08345 [Hyphomonas sp. TMED17]
MSVYIIAEFQIHDRSEYDKYDAGFMDVFEKFDGQLLSVDENPAILEGDWVSTRSVLIEFPSEDSAMAWLNSDGYKAIVGSRLAGSTGRARLVKSFAS